MNLSVNARAAAAFALVATCAVAAACADSAEEQAVDLEDSGRDAGDTPEASTLPPTSTDAGDADVDVTVPADAGDAEDAGDAGPKKVCTVQGWCHTELPPKQTLRAVWGDGTGIVWTVSEQGNILRWDGTEWSIVYTDTGKLHTIWGSGPTDIWVGGTNGFFHGTGATSATLSWTRFASEGNIPVLSLWGTSANDVWAVGNNGATTSRVFHYGGAPVDPAESGWTVDPVPSSVAGTLTKVWGYGPTDVWVMGSYRNGTLDQPLIWHLSPDGAGVPTFTRDESFTFYSRNVPTGGITSDTNNIFWFGTTSGNPYGMWQRRPDSTQPYTFKHAFTGVPQSTATCGSLVKYGMLAFGPSDLWLYGDFGRLCHWDGARWDQAAVSIDKYPLTNPFWDAWAPNGDASQMWVVGQDVALRKQATSKP